MAIYWPPDVNQNHVIGSLEEQGERNVASFAPEIGPPKERRRSSVATRTLAFEQVFDADERVSLATFYRDALRDGVLTFLRKSPIDGVPAEFAFAAPPRFREIRMGHYRAAISLLQVP